MLLLVATGAAATEIEPGIYRIEGLGDSLPKDDLEPLAGIVGKAELVGLGEAVHTSGDFYRAKFRIFRYLVEELGFRVTFTHSADRGSHSPASVEKFASRMRGRRSGRTTSVSLEARPTE